MSFLRLKNPLRTRPDPKREDRPDHDDWPQSSVALQGEIEPADAMRRALSEDEPSRLRKRIEAVETRAAAAEAEARKAKSDHAKAVLELARAVENSKDAQRRLRADLQTEIDALREALRLANADNWSNSGGAAMSEATKNALKANLALRLETIQERHIRELENLAEEAENRLAQELDSKLGEARAKSDRIRQDAMVERDRYWEDELERRLNLARMPAPMDPLEEPLDTAKETLLPRTWEIPFIATARSMLPESRQMLGCIGVGAVAAAIWFTAAQMSSEPSTETARATPVAPVASRVVTAAKPAPPAEPETVKESLPAPETSMLKTSDQAEPAATPATEPAEIMAETTPPIPPRAESADPATETTSPTIRDADPAQPPAETASQADKDTESIAQPTEAKVKAATGTQPAVDDEAAAQVRTLQRQATLLRQRLKMAERRAATARRDALTAAIALEEAQARIQPANDPAVPARRSETIDPIDIFAPTE